MSRLNKNKFRSATLKEVTFQYKVNESGSSAKIEKSTTTMIKIIRKIWQFWEQHKKKYDLSLEGHKFDQEAELRINYIALLFS